MIDCDLSNIFSAGTVESNVLYESFKAGTTPPLSAPMAGVRKSFSEGNIKLFARATSVEAVRGELATLPEEGTNGDAARLEPGLPPSFFLTVELQQVFRIDIKELESCCFFYFNINTDIKILFTVPEHQFNGLHKCPLL